MRALRTSSVRGVVEPRLAELAVIARREWLLRILVRRDQPIAFLFGFATLHIVHRRVKRLSAPWRADPIRFTEDLWLEDRPER
jgi:hypothetical protein